MKNKTLSDFAFYVSEKCDAIIANKNNYIGTDNMLPNYGGIIESEYLPNASNVNVYKKDDILISNIRPYFKKIWRADCDGTCSSDVLVIRAKNNITSSLLYYYLSRDVFFDYVTKGSSGSKMPRGNKNHIMKFPVNNISELDGNKIVNLIENIDKRIKNNKVISTNLENLGELLYNYWFIQFDFPDENGKPYKSSGGKMSNETVFGRKIPSTFELKRIKDIAKITTGKEDANFATEEGIYPYFTCSTETFKCDKAIFSGPSILIAGNGNFNVKHYNGEFNAYQRIYVVQPNESLFYGLTYMFIKSYIDVFVKKSAGSIVKYITISDVENIPILIPKNKSLIKVFTEFYSLIDELVLENQTLNELRGWLLPMLMNGQVKINGK